jgi:CheY-like chemotaxis protein
MFRFPCIFLADDDPDDREFFAAGMSRLYPQIDISFFSDGSELLNSLPGCAASALPDYLIFDYNMPNLSAPQLLEATGAGTRYHPIPKIVWSTSGRQKDIDECIRLGAIRYVIKPTTDDELELFLRSLQLPVPGMAIGAA